MQTKKFADIGPLLYSAEIFVGCDIGRVGEIQKQIMGMPYTADNFVTSSEIVAPYGESGWLSPKDDGFYNINLRGGATEDGKKKLESKILGIDGVYRTKILLAEDGPLGVEVRVNMKVLREKEKLRKNL